MIKRVHIILLTIVCVIILMLIVNFFRKSISDSNESIDTYISEGLMYKRKPKLLDEFTTIYGNAIFNVNKIETDKNVISFETGDSNAIIYIGLVTAYHYSNPQKTIINLRKKYKDIFIIICDGEPMDLKNTSPNMILSTKHERKYFPKNIPIIHIPYFTYLFRQNLTISDLNLLVKKSDVKQLEKPYFCSFITSNCNEKTFSGVKDRINFFKLLQERTNRVHSLGRCFNNYKIDENNVEKNNTLILKPYKFCICFENEYSYNSEKIIYPILANCIPIYLGSPIYKNYFNPRRIIDVSDYDSFESCIDYILQVDSNDELFLNIINEPFLKDNRIDKDLFSFAFGKGQCFRNIHNNLPDNIKKCVNFYSLFDNNIHFITFADGKIYKTDRIMKEAIQSTYFDKCTDMSNNINDFMNTHKNFIKNNKRGYGYWIWKHKIILEEYEKLNDNDILIYCDSGNTITKYNTSILKYLNTLITGSGMLFFPIKHKEGRWSKMDLVKQVFFDKNDDYINRILNEYQSTACIFMCRKCPNTTLYLNEVAKYSVVYDLINDSPSIIPNIKEFQENRHNQSVFSLCKHRYNFDISYDMFDDDPKVFLLPDNSGKKCFIATRKK